MSKFFTLQQAERILPEVETAIRAAISAKGEYESSDAGWRKISDRVTQRVTALGGMQVDRGSMAELKSRRDAAARALQEAFEKIQEFGCLVKDLDIGLIDFPTLFQGEEVYLCWKLGEPGIRFWHGVSEGFRGRKPIDAAFLEQHRGEVPN